MTIWTTPVHRYRHVDYETAMAGRDLTAVRASLARHLLALHRLHYARHVLHMRAGASTGVGGANCRKVGGRLRRGGMCTAPSVLA